MKPRLGCAAGYSEIVVAEEDPTNADNFNTVACGATIWLMRDLSGEQRRAAAGVLVGQDRRDDKPGMYAKPRPRPRPHTRPSSSVLTDEDTYTAALSLSRPGLRLESSSARCHRRAADGGVLSRAVSSGPS